MTRDTLMARPLAKLAVWIGAIAVFVIAVALATRGVINNITPDLSAPGGSLWDFRDASYFSVRAVLDGVIPWDVGRYFAAYPVGQEFSLLPPMYLVVHAPFQIFDLNTAMTAAFAVNLLAVVVFTAWSLSLARYRVTPLLVVAVSSLVVVSNGGRNVLFSGQASLLFAAGCYLALTARSEAVGGAGVFIGLIKPAFGGPVAALLLVSGRWKRSLVGALVATGISIVLMVPFVVWAGGVGDLVSILSDNVAFSASSPWINLGTTTARIDLTATIASLTGLVPPPGVEFAIGVTVMAIAGAALFVRRSTIWQRSHGDAATVLICLATLIGLYHSFYDLVLLVLPAMLVARRDFVGGKALRTVRIALLVSLLIASFNPFRFGTIAQILGEESRLYHVLSPGLTGLSLAVAFGLTVAVVVRLRQGD